MPYPGSSPSRHTLYQFISDPQHHETLSGRVRAACLTCRKKKTRCSGKIPCSTCIAKGVICDGFAARKRPEKNRDLRRLHGIAELDTRTSNDSASKPRSDRSPTTTPDRLLDEAIINDGYITSPTLALQKSRTASSDESGYVSSQRDHDYDPTTIRNGHVYDDHARTFMPPVYTSSSEASPTMTAATAWSLFESNDTLSIDWTYSSPIPAPQYEAHLSATTTAHQSNLSDVTSGYTPEWRYSTSSGHGGMDLVSAAMVLEEQAQTLRRLALEHEVITLDDVKQHETVPPLRDHASPMDLSMNCPPASFNATALSFAGQYQGSGGTMATLPDVNTWPWITEATGNLRAPEWYFPHI